MNSDVKIEKENFEKKDYKEIRDFFSSNNNMSKYDSLFKYYNNEINLNDKLYLPKIITELNLLIEDGFGFTILPYFSIPYHKLLEYYINSDLDEENSINSIKDFQYIKLFVKLKNYIFYIKETENYDNSGNYFKTSYEFDELGRTSVVTTDSTYTNGTSSHSERSYEDGKEIGNSSITSYSDGTSETFSTTTIYNDNGSKTRKSISTSSSGYTDNCITSYDEFGKMIYEFIFISK